MAEPQEQSAMTKVMTKQQKYSAKILEEGKSLPAEMVSAAERQLAGFKLVKAEIDAEIAKQFKMPCCQTV